MKSEPHESTEQEPLPTNVLVLASHGSHEIPMHLKQFLSPEFKNRPELLKNFSDHVTQILIEDIPEEQRAIPRYGRIAGDPNRAKESHDWLRMEDFNGVPLWNEDFQKRLEIPWYRRQIEDRLAQKSYDPYFEEIFEKLGAMAEKGDKDAPVIVLDIHDTGNWMLGANASHDKKREVPVSRVEVSNRNGKTAPAAVVQIIKETLAGQLGMNPEDVREMIPAEGGGYVTRLLGGDTEMADPRLQKIKEDTGREIFVVQIELDRSYMDEVFQRPLEEKVQQVSKTVKAIIQALGTSTP